MHLVEYGKRGRDPPESEWEWWRHWYDHQDQMTYHRQKECLCRDGLGILYFGRGAPRGIPRIVLGEKSRKHVDHSGGVEGITGDTVL